MIRPAAMQTAPAGWELLAHMRRVMCARSDVAYAVRCLSLPDQLELTLELLNQWQESEPELPVECDSVPTPPSSLIAQPPDLSRASSGSGPLADGTPSAA
jgi:hypothetical protein